MGMPSAPTPQKLVSKQDYDQNMKRFLGAEGAPGVGDFAKNFIGAARQDYADANVVAPPPAPDVTDELVQRAANVQRRRLLAQSGIQSTFLTGPIA